MRMIIVEDLGYEDKLDPGKVWRSKMKRFREKYVLRKNHILYIHLQIESEAQMTFQVVILSVKILQCSFTRQK